MLNKKLGSNYNEYISRAHCSFVGGCPLLWANQTMGYVGQLAAPIGSGSMGLWDHRLIGMDGWHGNKVARFW